MEKAVAIITARGGSKRIPHKNIKEFCGRPIICYSIAAALDAKVFDEVMVSTDDEEIAAVALATGARVPFRRSAKTADDFATTDDVIKEVLDAYKAAGKEFTQFCCIYPTAPFVTAAKLRKAMEMLTEADGVMPVVPFSYPPQRSITIVAGQIKRKYPEYLYSRSQDLEKLYHDCGQFYACRTDAFMQAGTINTENLVPMILSETEVQDIDTLEDWQLAEMKFRNMLKL